MATIADFLKSAAATVTQSSADRLSDAVARLSAQLEAATADADSAKLAHESALVDHALDPGAVDDKTLAKLKAAADAARDRLGSLQGALVTLHARLSAAEAANARQEHKDRWDRAIGVSQFRLEAMRKVAKSMEMFAADYRAAVEINGQLVAALPATPDPDGAMTRADLFEAALRRELVRLGCPWAAKLVQPACDLPPMLPQFEGAHELVQRWAPGA